MASKLSVVTKKPKQFPQNATFPPPRSFKVQDSPTNPRAGLAFFEYWKEIAGTAEHPKDRADLITAKFYLHVPVVSYKMVDPSRTNAIFASVEGPLWFENPDDYEEEVPARFGAARWHVLLNETGIHGHLMEAYFSAGTWDKYPLKIDLNTLVRSDPKNSDYLQWLKANDKKTPWDNPEEEDDMANSDALKIVADVLKDQSQTAIETTRELADVRVEAAQQEAERAREESADRGDKRANAESESIKLVTDVARDMVSMAREDRRAEVNPLEVIRTAVELVRPQGDTSGTAMFIEALKDSQTKMLEMQASNQEFMRSVLGIKKAPDGTWTAAETQQANGFEAEVTRFQRMADIFGYQKPGAALMQQQQDTRPPREPEKSVWGAIAENIVPFCTMVTTVITLGANLVYNLRAEPGKATSPAEALQKAQAATPPPQQQAQQQASGNPKDLRTWMPFANHILQTGAFRAHFHGKDSNLSGFTFAEFILSDFTGGAVNEKGRKGYSSIQENLGLAGFDKLIRATPGLWDIVKDTPQQYEQFLQEFFSYDEMMSQQQQPEGQVA